MLSVDLAGIGVWGDRFGDWAEFCSAIGGGAGASGPKLYADLLAARERRRASTFVKIAITVMDQACAMAEFDRSSVATVFGSAMGDVQIMDYMCGTLAAAPRTISPTRFHNSVHNAPTAYWSIATGSNSPSNAVSGHNHSSTVALLEGAAQAVAEEIPVVVAAQELATTGALRSVRRIDESLAVALLLVPRGRAAAPFGALMLEVVDADPPARSAGPPRAPGPAGNYTAELLDLLLAVAAREDSRLGLPLSPGTELAVTYRAGPGP